MPQNLDQLDRRRVSPEEIRDMIGLLRDDPERIRTLFPRIGQAAPAELPAESERPLVILPRADAWADS
jgi:hypothetical protein